MNNLHIKMRGTWDFHKQKVRVTVLKMPDRDEFFRALRKNSPGRADHGFVSQDFVARIDQSRMGFSADFFESVCPTDCKDLGATHYLYLHKTDRQGIPWEAFMSPEEWEKCKRFVREYNEFYLGMDV